MTTIIKIILIIIMTMAGTFGAFFFKRGTTKLSTITIKKMIKTIDLYIGVLFYLVGAIMNILLLKHIPYTIVYPMTSLTYIWTMIVSYLFLKEKINKCKIIAVICIISGVIIINY